MSHESEILHAYLESYPADAAQVLGDFPPAECAALLEQLPPVLSTPVLSAMDLNFASQCLQSMAPKRGGELTELMSLEVGAAILRLAEKDKKASILNAVSAEKCKTLKHLIGFPQNTAGALMTPHVLSLPHDLTVTKAIERLTQFSRNSLYYLYIIDRDLKLVGVLHMSELMAAEPTEKLAKIMHKEVASISADFGPEAILSHPGWRDFHAMPVVTRDGVFVGAIRYGKLRNLERGQTKKGSSTEARMAGAAFAELFRIGLTGLVQGAAEGLGKSDADDLA